MDDSSSPYPIFIVVIIQCVITSLHICLTTACVSCLRAFSSVYISPHLALSLELSQCSGSMCVCMCICDCLYVYWSGEGRIQKKKLECGLNDEIISKYYSFIFLSNNYRKSLSCVQLSETPWPQTIQPIEFSRQEYWSGELFPSQGMFQSQGSNPGLWQCRQILYHLSHQGNPQITKHTI